MFISATFLVLCMASVFIVGLMAGAIGMFGVLYYTVSR